jgi:CspA family cold shock protein
MKGTVKWFNARRGYGFIEGEDNKDIFVHKNALEQGVFLLDGENVEFDIEDSEKGPTAINVKKIKNT